MRIQTISAVVLLTASAALADATIDQKTQFHFTGALGTMINVFSRGAREGVTSTEVVKGNRKLRRTESTGELIDLDQEKIYTIDYDRKSYSVKTFADLRREWEQQQERAKKNAERAKTQKGEGPEYQVDFAVKSAGHKEEINGWNTHEELVTVTVHEKGKKLEKSGGFVLTSDLWMGPKVAAMRELADFERRFVQKAYGPAFNADMRSMAMAMAMTPAFGEAMKTFYEHRASFDGTPIRTRMTFETVSGTDQPKESADKDESQSAPAAVIGGLFNKMKQRREEKKSEEPADPNRSQLFDSTVDVLKATSSASAADVAIPAGFKLKS
jgi:hypothetical protein